MHSFRLQMGTTSNHPSPPNCAHLGFVFKEIVALHSVAVWFAFLPQVQRHQKWESKIDSHKPPNQQVASHIMACFGDLWYQKRGESVNCASHHGNLHWNLCFDLKRHNVVYRNSPFRYFDFDSLTCRCVRLSVMLSGSKSAKRTF